MQNGNFNTCTNYKDVYKHVNSRSFISIHDNFDQSTLNTGCSWLYFLYISESTGFRMARQTDLGYLYQCLSHDDD